MVTPTIPLSNARAGDQERVVRVGGAGVEKGSDEPVGEVASEECGGALEDYEDGASGCGVGELVRFGVVGWVGLGHI